MVATKFFFTVCRVFKRKITIKGGDKIQIAGCKGGIHVSVYMHANVCTMIVQNDNARGGGQNPQGGAQNPQGWRMPRPPKKPWYGTQKF